MAIQFARLQYVQRSKGQSSCHKGAYNARDKIYDLRQEKNFDYSGRGDCAYHAVMLPAGASEKYQDIGALWNTIEAIENRVDSQVAKEMVLALPDDSEVTLEDKIAMTRSFLKEHFMDHGIICQIDIHAPHDKKNPNNWEKREDHKDGNNWHAHVLMTTRPCLEGEMFGNKARNLDVDVRKGRVVSTDKQWGMIWGQHQNKYFKENGIDLEVDPIGVVAEIHLGPVRMRGKNTRRVKENEERKNKNLFHFQDERLVLKALVRQNSTFERKDVEAVSAKFIESEHLSDFLGRFWTSDQIVLVGEDRYTTKAVIEEERKLMRVADRMTQNHVMAREPNYQIDLNEEQQRVVEYVCQAPNLSCVEGKAGTGKSRMLGAIRETYEAEGKTVRGFSPTSVVADDMLKDGFKYAVNLHRFLFHLRYDRVSVEKGEIWLVDEAGMIPTPVMGELIDNAWRKDAKLVLVGDSQQLVSIERGGSFKALTERFGSEYLENIMRQQNSNQREITAQIAKGDAGDALTRMGELGMWTHHSDEREAVKALMDKWHENYKANPTDSFVILEFRNQFVREFNKQIHEVLQSRGEVSSKDILINTARFGFMKFSVGDSIVFKQNDTAKNINNGERGVLIAASEKEFTVRVDDARDITFDPEKYNDFQHGYAYTFHTSQGSTFDRVYALHFDSKYMSQNLFYVANSRHRLSCNYFSYGNVGKVYEQVMRVDGKVLAQGQEAFDEEPRSWLSGMFMAIKDYMTSNHEFYNNKDRDYILQGYLITNYEEQAFMTGFKPLYREEQKDWPKLEESMIRTSSQHADLEVFLREQGVGQCILIDVSRNESQLIGPYDRFHALYEDQQRQMMERDISEAQLRLRLFALEKRLGESPHSATDMANSKSYEMMMHHETTLKPELLKTHDAHMTTQVLYYFEQTGEMPVGEELHKIQQRVISAAQHHSQDRTDDIFIDALTREQARQVQFQKQRQLQMER